MAIGIFINQDHESWEDLRDDIVVNLQKYSREFSDCPAKAVYFALALPGELHSLLRWGQNEGWYNKLVNLPPCFTERAARVEKVSCRLKSNLKHRALENDEAAIILSMLYIHVNRMAIRADARVQNQSTQFIARQMANMYGSPTSASQRESETFIAWNILSAPLPHCHCITCLADKSEA